MSFKTPHKILLVSLVLGLAPAFALAGSSLTRQAGSAFVNMFPAWISLAGGIIVLVLASKYMSGGRLAGPFSLIGIGILIDAVFQIASSFAGVGLLPDVFSDSQIIWSVGLAFRLTVVVGVIWIAGVFGVLRHKKSAPKTSRPGF